MQFAKLPKVDRILAAPALASDRERLGHRVLVGLARQAIAEWRERVRSGALAPSEEDVVADVLALSSERSLAGLRHVINATGVLLHTNLGRAPLPPASVERIVESLRGYSNLEYDIGPGVRARRGGELERRMADLVGAEDTLLVNNNAAAVLLSLTALATHREVIVSRGELVEIGGGFRIPDVLLRSGARLVEVGTTNRTRVADYAAAVGEHTAALLRVHPSNFKISGFVERPALHELAELAREHGIPLVKDLGGGLVVELPEQLRGEGEYPSEPSVSACLKAGADLVCFSLDKLFGGPQGGVVAGRRDLVARLRKDPLARALRVDKLMLAALEPVLDAYSSDAPTHIPIHAMLATSLLELEQRVTAWQETVRDLAPLARAVPSEAAIGGGTLAEVPCASVGLLVPVHDPEGFLRQLRRQAPPVVARISEGAVILDARSVLPAEDSLLVAALRAALCYPVTSADPLGHP